MMDHYNSKLDNLELDNDTTTMKFINAFDLFVQKIGKIEGKCNEAKKIQEFKKRVSSEDYDIEKRSHKSTFADLVKEFHARE